jgi:hypothetical protein
MSIRVKIRGQFPNKNDLKDAKVIANLIKNGDYTEPTDV